MENAARTGFTMIVMGKDELVIRKRLDHLLQRG